MKLRLIRLAIVTGVLFALTSGCGAGGSAGAGSNDVAAGATTPDVTEGDSSPTTNTGVQTSIPITTTTVAPTTTTLPPMPYSKGSALITDTEGWTWRFRPNVPSNVSSMIEFHKSVEQSPPGKARLGWVVSAPGMETPFNGKGGSVFGTVESTVAGRTPPELEMATDLVFPLPVEIGNEFDRRGYPQCGVTSDLLDGQEPSATSANMIRLANPHPNPDGGFAAFVCVIAEGGSGYFNEWSESEVDRLLEVLNDRKEFPIIRSRFAGTGEYCAHWMFPDGTVDVSPFKEERQCSVKPE